MKRNITSLIACVLLTISLLAQEKKLITNADVTGMVKGGLAESTIVMLIQQSDTNFDTSPQALIELKSQGVSQRIMEAMIAKTAAPAASLSRSAVVKTVSNPDLPSEYGIHYKGPNGWVRLQQVVAGSAKMKGALGAMINPIGMPSMASVFRGAKSLIQISEPRPTFYVVGPNINVQEIVIVALERKKDSRELSTSSGTALNMKIGYRDKDLREINVSQVSKDVISIVPKVDLKPGEYLIVSQPYSEFDFGIAEPSQKK